MALSQVAAIEPSVSNVAILGECSLVDDDAVVATTPAGNGVLQCPEIKAPSRGRSDNGLAPGTSFKDRCQDLYQFGVNLCPGHVVGRKPGAFMPSKKTVHDPGFGEVRLTKAPPAPQHLEPIGVEGPIGRDLAAMQCPDRQSLALRFRVARHEMVMPGRLSFRGILAGLSPPLDRLSIGAPREILRFLLCCLTWIIG